MRLRMHSGHSGNRIVVGSNVAPQVEQITGIAVSPSRRGSLFEADTGYFTIWMMTLAIVATPTTAATAKEAQVASSWDR
jgi:hypothetical protein